MGGATLSHAYKGSPPVSPELRNRQREISRPLFAIADAIGGDWPQRVRSALVKIFAGVNADPADDIKIQLLTDIREAFGDQDRMASADLIDALQGMKDRPWASWGKSGKGLNQNQLARLLKDFKLYPATVWLKDGRTAKGYKLESFKPIWDRYLPKTHILTVRPSGPASTLAETDFSNRQVNFDLTVEKREKPASLLEPDGLTVGKPVFGGGGAESDIPVDKQGGGRPAGASSKPYKRGISPFTGKPYAPAFASYKPSGKEQ